MARQQQPLIENNFTKGLITEATGLNFPENASTETYNCVFSRIGNVTRRLGIEYEVNKTLTTIDRTSSAISYYKWKNAGGDGDTQVFVLQVGGTLHFFSITAATVASPLSSNKLASTITLSTYTPSGGSSPNADECQFTDGNGYLFVFHPKLEPFYCTYSSGTVTSNQIQVKIRDFAGIPESGIADDFRPPTLTTIHNYNLLNQGWVNQPDWTATSTTSNTIPLSGSSSKTWTVQTGLTISVGHSVSMFGAIPSFYGIHPTGTVTSYNSLTGVLVISIPETSQSGTSSNWTFTHTGTSYITTFFTDVGTLPGNSDVWWRYKNSSEVFDPATMNVKITLDSAPAPKGHYILDAFNRDRTSISSITGLTTVTTTTRPKTGCWFQGRVWYAGTNASFAASGTAPYSSWTESIYFSQIVEKEEQFGRCYQINDPTSENLFDLLPSDGGVVRIQGCGGIYRLFPIQNGLLVFAANGIWFITGSQGIGFAANDYVIAKLSSIQSISSTSFVDVQGMPMWWNEEGIYTVTMGGGTNYGSGRGAETSTPGLQVQPLTFSTISSFYENIPLSSKKYVRGDFDSLNWQVHWTYRTTEESSVTNRYEFDGVLTLSTLTQAFSPWVISSTSSTPHVHGVAYIQAPGGSTFPAPVFKYITSFFTTGVYKFTFSEERSTAYVDWATALSTDYNSYFVTGYKILGQAQRKFQSNYVYVFSNNDTDTTYKIQGIFGFANDGDSGRYSSEEVATHDIDNYKYLYKRHKIRGHGLAVQFKINSVAGEPFDIIGWSAWNTANAGV